jgi:hypothetical protein
MKMPDLSKMTMGIIGCVSVEDSPIPDPEQKNCVVENCLACKQEIWVSEKKRELRKEHPKLVTMCMRCGVLTMKILQEEGVVSETLVNLAKKK